LRANISAVNLPTPSSSARAAEHLEQQGAEAPPLPFVEHGDGDLGRVRPPGVAHVEGVAQALLPPLVEGDHRFVVVMIELGHVAHRPVAERVRRGQEAPVARLRAQVLEPPHEQLAVRAVALADPHTGAVAQRDRDAELVGGYGTFRAHSGISDPTRIVRSSGSPK
jgi:hypothetical protein